MHADIAGKRDALSALCRRFGVARLEVFGSAARGTDFDPQRSDIDFLVAFEPDLELPPLERFFGLAEALEALFGRPVDLVEDGAMRNPYVRAGVDRSREPVYGS
ncbi:MAG: nucleotidyltransferase domain-containing protein [Roseiarcus sp.]|jgi:predicted nucleotidyltransferase